MSVWDVFTGKKSSKSSTETIASTPTTNFSSVPFDPSSAQDVSSFLGSASLPDASQLHPLAGLNQQTLDYLSLDESTLSDLPGSRSALPSRGWSDDLCYGTGVTYLTALSIGGAWGLIEGLNRTPASAPPKLRLNSVLNSVTRRGPFLGNSAGVIAMVYNGFNSIIGHYRGKHDSANSIVAGALSGMLFKSTRGLKPMAISGGIVATMAGTWARTVREAGHLLGAAAGNASLKVKLRPKFASDEDFPLEVVTRPSAFAIFRHSELATILLRLRASGQRAATAGGQLRYKTPFNNKYTLADPNELKSQPTKQSSRRGKVAILQVLEPQTSSSSQPSHTSTHLLPIQHNTAASTQNQPRKGPSKVYGKRRRNGKTSVTSASFASLALDPDLWWDMTIPDGQKATQLRHDFGRQLRSSSPAVKRPASDMGAQDREEHTSDVDMDRGSSPPTISVTGSVDDSSAPETTPKAKQQDTGVRHERQTSVDMLSSNPQAAPQKTPSEESASTASLPDSLSPTVSSKESTSATSIEYEPPPSVTAVPTIDEQVTKVTELILRPLQDKQKGYVVSAKWLSRVLARSSVRPGGETFDKSATEGEIGPVDNSDLVLVTEGSGHFLDEAGDPFVLLRPGLQHNDDYQIVPEEAWRLILKWYGYAKDSPIITRYVHNTSTGGEENCQYELNPPIFSLLKIPGVHSSQSTDSQSDTQMPVRTLASRSTSFMAWLKNAKKLVGIDINSRVRVWKVLGGLKSSSGSGMLTPAASRSASPAPGANIVASAGDRLVLDVGSFISLQIGDERELLDVSDNTMNEKYNGSLTLGLVGLSKDEVIVLEEQIGGAGGGEWPSNMGKSGSALLAVSKSAAAAEKKGKGSTASGRSSPAPGMITRGRQRKEPRTKGITGLGNLGNTCYMNSALQCIRSVEELTQYFLHDDYKQELNPSNPLGHHGNVAKAYAALLNSIYSTNSSFSPTQFKATIGKYGVNFSGYGQQDSQEFLLFLLDGLQEDLNRVKKKPYIEKPDSTDDMVHNPAALKAFADQNWDIYKARNDSVVTDLFAGMYKSTVTCPVCDKVSIIFDPFNTLTLQLPIENNWSKEVYFFPLHNRPVRVDVDIDKNASMRALKEFVAKRVGCEPERMVTAESYKSKFYRMFDDITTVSEANIQSADIICLYEVESVPTNYDPKKQKKTTFYSSKEKEEIPDINSPAADRLLVPIFNRVVKSSNSRQRTFFGEPCYVVITRENAKTYDGVLRKILGKVATMTTRNILDDDVLAHPPITTPEDSDTVVMHDDDQSSDSNQIQTASVEGEDGFVDVSVKNTADGSMPTSAATNPTTHAVLQPGSFIPPILQNLFQIKVVTSGEVIPLGLNQIDEHKPYTSVSERASRQLPHRPAKHKKATGMTNGLTTLNSSDEDTDDVTQNCLAAIDDESEGSSIEHDEPASASESDASDGLHSFSSMIQDARPSSCRNNKRKTYSRKGKKVATVDPTPDEIPSLIRPGEGILLDWEWDPYDALFEGVEDDDRELRGSPTWKKVELYYDEELVKKRATRQSRRRNGITLDDCLNEFGKEETLSENNAWYCPKCKEHRQAQKKFELWRTPDILVMHLKRFSSNRNFRDKLDLPVIFPLDDLNLQDRVLWKEEGKTLIYDLFAVDNHYGGLGGGHYTAYAQSFLNKEWYEYNDSSVSLKHAQSVVTPAAYLLFYRRRSDRPLGGQKLEEMMAAINGPPAADCDSRPTSRDASPSGEGPRLGDPSYNGLSSAITAAGQARHVGDGGSAPMQIPGAYHEDESLGKPNVPDDDVLPGYEDAQFIGPQQLGQSHMDLDRDEAIDVSYQMHDHQAPPWDDNPGWGFNGLGSGRAAPSQMMAVPPGSLDFNQDVDAEDLFENGDGASLKVQGGDGSSAGNMSDNDERMKSLNEPGESALSPLIRRNERESAPPPHIIEGGEEVDESPVVDVRIDDDTAL